MDELQRLLGLVSGAPARPLKPGFRGNRGRVVLLGQPIAYESDLERDFLLLLQFDSSLAGIREQPVTIPCKAADGRQTKYTPDFITVHAAPAPWGCVTEVKPAAMITKEWITLRPRLMAGRDYAHQNGLSFMLLTERQIRSAPLEAMRFLVRFKDLPTNECVEKHLVHRLAGLGPSTPPKLLAAAFRSQQSQAEALPYLWKLVANGRIIAAVGERPLTMSTVLWIDGDSGWRGRDPYSWKQSRSGSQSLAKRRKVG